MKKKIAVVFNHMLVGGAEKVLINLLKVLDTDSYDVTLFTYNDKGAYFDEIPSSVQICFTECSALRQHLIDDIVHLRLFSVFRGVFWRIVLRLCQDEYQKLGCMMRIQSKFEGYFDCAIAYKMNYPDTATVIWRINAKKKCVVMHSEFAKQAKRTAGFLRILGKKMDRIFCVSEAIERNAAELNPMFLDKTVVMHNAMDIEEIRTKANMAISMDCSQVCVLTVGRLSPEKGQQMVPKTARMLLDAGYDIHWYLVGDGPLREEIEQEIQKYDVSDRVILLGTKTNPYPYIKNCKIYVQPSFSEGYCTTTMEAKVLCKPVVTTDAPGMREQFVSGENGLIVDAMTPEALFEGIRTLLDHPELCRKFEEKLRQESIDDAANAKELQKLYDFIES